MGGFSHQDSCRQRVCSSRRVILILMGLLAVVTLSLVVLGFKGRKSSMTLLKMQEDLKASNRTVAVELAALQEMDTNNLKTLQKADQMVKNLTEEAKEVKSQFLDQINKLQRTLQEMNCDLEDMRHKRKGPGSGCCPRGWHLFQWGCYWLSSAEKPWTEAKVDCEEKNAHLVVITGYLEEQFVFRLAKHYQTWIGLCFSGREWRWVDGTPYTRRKVNWEPNVSYSPMLCSVMYRNGLWNEIFCQTRLRWMCEQPAQQ